MNVDTKENTQLDSMKELVQLSAERTYMNAERTLSVWIRTALGAMIFGIAIDRFGIMLRELLTSKPAKFQFHMHIMHITGIVLVISSMILSFVYSLRFIRYSRDYKKDFSLPAAHNMWLSPLVGFLVILFGIPLLILMIWI